MIPINVACEDILSEAIADKILASSNKEYIRGLSIRKNGNSYLKQRVIGLNNAAKGMPYLLLADLDRTECPPRLILEWLGRNQKHPNLIFRVAVVEVEAWVLADRVNFAKFFGVSASEIPENADSINNPKDFIVRIARNSSRRDIRSGLVPKRNSTAKVGPNYNSRLIEFVNSNWVIGEAIQRSTSLKKMVEALEAFKPTYLVKSNEQN